MSLWRPGDGTHRPGDDPDEGVFGEGDFGWINVEHEPVEPGDQPGPDAYRWSPEAQGC